MKAKYIKKIIGLVGKKHSGKDTFYANCLELFLNGDLALQPKRFAFADSLKEVVANELGISLSELSKNKALYRTKLQEIGVAKRQLDKEFWINELAKKLLRYELHEAKVPSLVIITDVRFLNEAEFLHKLKAKLIRITRPSTDNDIDKHISETELELINYDYPLENRGSNNLYKHQILDTLKQLNLCS